MSAPAADALDALEAKNTDVVLRYLRVFETYDLGELAAAVDPDVVGHGAGQTAHGTKCHRLRDGRIAELWGETDLYGFLRQAGLVPAEFPPM